MIDWQWRRFEDLDIHQLYEILRVRQEVFAVEQDCAYQDADGKDSCAWHLCGWSGRAPHPQLQAYLRVVDPGQKFDEPSIGRVLTAASARGTGLGRELMRRVLDELRSPFPDSAIRISAQQHLQKFYGEFGFIQCSEVYDEDGIPHIEMLRPPQSIG